MYLSNIQAENFRLFGDKTSTTSLNWSPNKAMNILVGENESGKSSVIDAIRLLLWTTSLETMRATEQDFHINDTTRATTLMIEGTFRDLTPEQESAILEWLTYETDGTRSLVLNLQARRQAPQPGRRARIESITRSGRNGSGPEIGSAVRDLVRATYLRALRDAEAELRPGRQSRLSQILGAHPLMSGQELNDYDPKPNVEPATIVGIMQQAQARISRHKTIETVETDINNNYLTKMSLLGSTLKSQIRISADASLSQILDRFELGLLPPAGVSTHERCSRGLGYNNALFMATELVLLRGEEGGILLIEEPEAHLHPQLQDRIMELLKPDNKNNTPPLQIIITTHSPSLASGADVESMTLMTAGRTYPLRAAETRLSKSDYEYLRRFIDATKANLFFARGVAIVEGPAEALILPAIAEVTGLSLSHHGVSIVNVGNIGLYHYARVLQRSGKESIPVPVACITDRDVVPDIAKAYVDKPKKGKRFESEYSTEDLAAVSERKRNRVQSLDDPNVRVFVSDYWTLEHDLARSGLAKLVFVATSLGQRQHTNGEALTEQEETKTEAEALLSWESIKATDPAELACTIYQPLYEKEASKAVTAQYIAKLLRSGAYGTGKEILKALPSYLRDALHHLTRTKDTESAPIEPNQ